MKLFKFEDLPAFWEASVRWIWKEGDIICPDGWALFSYWGVLFYGLKCDG